MQNENRKSANKKSHQFYRCIFLVILICFCTFSIKAQTIQNTAFQSGEVLQYDLYYNWHFLWVKAGSASMSITSTIYQGQPAYRTRMLTRGSSQADKFFVLRNTLTSIITQDDMLPRYYSKTDLEKDSYRQRQVWYEYDKTTTNSKAKQLYINPQGNHSWKTEKSDQIIYDMLSILLQARSFDATEYKKGHKIKFIMTDGNGIAPQTLIFRGRKTMKMKNGSATYKCLVLSFVEYDEKGKENEVVTFYVTDDKNHIPVRLDLFLRIGTAKAYLTAAKNVRNPITAKK